MPYTEFCEWSFVASHSRPHVKDPPFKTLSSTTTSSLLTSLCFCIHFLSFPVRIPRPIVGHLPRYGFLFLCFLFGLRVSWNYRYFLPFSSCKASILDDPIVWRVNLFIIFMSEHSVVYHCGCFLPFSKLQDQFSRRSHRLTCQSIYHLSYISFE